MRLVVFSAHTPQGAGNYPRYVVAIGRQAVPIHPDLHSTLLDHGRRPPRYGTAIAGMPDLVVAGETGLILPAGNVPLLAEAMESLARSSHVDFAAMSSAAQPSSRRRYSAPACGV